IFRTFPRAPQPTLFPYTTLFRSLDDRVGDERGAVDDLADGGDGDARLAGQFAEPGERRDRRVLRRGEALVQRDAPAFAAQVPHRSEEHTSELQSPDHLVSRLLLE